MSYTDLSLQQLVSDRVASLHTTAERTRNTRRVMGRRLLGRRIRTAGATPTTVSAGALPSQRVTTRPPSPFTDDFATWAAAVGAAVAESGIGAIERSVGALVKQARRHGVSAATVDVLADRSASPAPRERALGVVLVALAGTAAATPVAAADREIA